MNLRSGSIKFFSVPFKITVCIFAFAISLASISTAQAALTGVFKNQHCDTFLTPGHGYTTQAFSETEEGRAVYSHLRRIVGTHSSSLVEVVNSHPEWSISDVLNFIANDRDRIESGLNAMLSEFRIHDDHRKMVEYVLEHFAQTLHKERFAKQLKFYHSEYGAISARQVSSSTHPQLMNFLYKAWAVNRSSVSELLTAFEVKGVYALSVKVYELLPPAHLEEFVKVFTALGKSQILELEIDVAARDPQTGRQVWIEVKNVNNRIYSSDYSALKDYREKKNRLLQFNDIIEQNPRLKSLFRDSVEFVWIIRGAGVERSVIEKQSERGLYLFDRTATGINDLIEKRNKAFRHPHRQPKAG